MNMKENRMVQNRAFEEMRKYALERLEERDILEIARNTDMEYDREKNLFYLSSLGREVRIFCPGYEIEPELDEWHQLLIYHYMDLADGTELTGELMAFGDLPGGMVRGGGFDRQSEQTLSLRFGHCTMEQMIRACKKLGGTLIPSNADICAVFSVLPLYPVTFKLWFSDDEIQGSGRLFLDKSAAHFLTVEDAVTAGTLLLEALLRETTFA